MNVLYLSYTGLLEPLGRSQIFAYLSRLSGAHNLSLVTVEKKEDLKDDAAVADMKEQCRLRRIKWVALTYHRRPRVPATVWDLFGLFSTSARLIRRDSIDVVHCRGYIAAMVALLLRAMTATPFIFDMRALWVDEMITARRLDEGSLLHRVLQLIERRLLLSASVVVSLTQAATDHLVKETGLPRSKFAVIPTCTDLSLFTPQQRMSRRFVLGSVGTISSGWFPVGWLMRFYAELLRHEPEAELRIVTRDTAEGALLEARRLALPLDRIMVLSRDPADVPREMAAMTAGVVLNVAGVGRLGSLPTRMGEFLACGVPCIGNKGVGDVAEIIRRFRVGVSMENDSDEAVAAGVKSLFELLDDPSLSDRCRAAADEYFSVDRGVEAYDRMYREIGDRGSAP